MNVSHLMKEFVFQVLSTGNKFAIVILYDGRQMRYYDFDDRAYGSLFLGFLVSCFMILYLLYTLLDLLVSHIKLHRASASNCLSPPVILIYIYTLEVLINYCPETTLSSALRNK